MSRWVGVTSAGVPNTDEHVHGPIIENIYHGFICNFYDAVCTVGGLLGGLVVVAVVGSAFPLSGLDINGLTWAFVLSRGAPGSKFIHGWSL